MQINIQGDEAVNPRCQMICRNWLLLNPIPFVERQICPLLIDMAFLSGFVRSGLSLLGKESASFPYSVGAKVEWFDEHSIWSLHQGTKKVHNETSACAPCWLVMLRKMAPTYQSLCLTATNNPTRSNLRGTPLKGWEPCVILIYCVMWMVSR